MSATERALAAYERIDAAGRPDIWIHLRSRDDVLADAAVIDARVTAGECLPLAGMTLAVKDNIDVEGTPTTAACPAYAYAASIDAPAVERLRSAGAIVLGKTNLDQFATGLAGTRSPYGAVADARRAGYVAGGSSSGSAVAVALGIADLALGTDTAGSGRVPAAFAGIVGVKPTRGVVPALGIVPASPSLDCVSVFARDARSGDAAARLLYGAVPGDPSARAWPADAPLGAPARPRIAVPSVAGLEPLDNAGRAAFAAACAQLAAAGAELVEVEVEPFLAAGRLLYDGGFVAERHAAIGAFVDAHPDLVDPSVRAIIAAAGAIPAHVLAADERRLALLRHAAEAELAAAGADALLLPTAPGQPTLAEVDGDPIGTVRRLGTYTNFCNLLDLCAVALPAGEAAGLQFGVTLFAPAFHDRLLADLARRFAAALHPAAAASATADTPAACARGPRSVELFVVGAHLSGQPLNWQLTDRGGALVGLRRTAASYRLFALATEPPKPGLVRVDGDGAGAAIAGEVWALPPAGLASLLAELPAPMALGPVMLEDGGRVTGFLCEPAALTGAAEITAYGGWRAYLADGTGGRAASPRAVATSLTS